MLYPEEVIITLEMLVLNFFRNLENVVCLKYCVKVQINIISLINMKIRDILSDIEMF